MIIESMIDNDWYKFTMQQAVLHQHPGAVVEYQFKCRTENIDFRAYVDEIIKEVNKMCTQLRFQKDEIEFMGDTGLFKPDTLQFWKIFRYDYSFIHIRADDEGTLHVHIKGPWIHTILFEIPVLSIISEVYCKDNTVDYEGANKRTMAKIDLINKFYADTGIEFVFAEFGGRRRHSVQAQRNALTLFKEYCYAPTHGFGLVGTSNPMFAKEMGLIPIGTMAHEWLQAHQALYRVEESQVMAFEHWAKEYRGDLGIALSDVICMKAFLYDFDMYFAKLFDGTRHDSGDPYQYGEQMIKHYNSMKIAPTTKTIVFSDGLTISDALNLAKYFHKRIKNSAGIGTHITNDFPEFKALQLVLKMVTCNGRPVAKISNTTGKTMSNDDGYVQYLKDTFNKRVQLR